MAAENRSKEPKSPSFTMPAEDSSKELKSPSFTMPAEDSSKDPKSPPTTSERRESKIHKGATMLAKHLLILFIILAVIIGVGLGFALRSVWSHRDLTKIWYLEFPGRILLNMLKAMSIPVVISSLVVGVADMGKVVRNKLGVAAIVYYFSTTFIAVFLGITLVLLIKPGDPGSISELDRAGKTRNVNPINSLLDLLSQAVPDNIFAAAFERKITAVGKKKYTIIEEDGKTNYTITVDKPYLTASKGPNLLGLIGISLFVGILLNSMGHEGERLKSLFGCINDLVFKAIDVIIMFTPVGLLFLVAGKFVSTKDLSRIWSSLALYLATVILGLFTHSCIILPSAYFVLTKKNPWTFGANQLKSILTAWGTASSSATLPVTMACLIENNKINPLIVGFVAPIGATINMDGTALYEAVATIFIAQLNGFDLLFSDVLVISVTATAAAIGAAGIPEAGLVTMVIVLTSVGLPTEDITLILAVDWFLDRFRTGVNVWGDAIGAGILHHFLRAEIEAMTHTHLPKVEDSLVEEDVVVEEGNDGTRKLSFFNESAHYHDDQQDAQGYSTRV